MDRPCSPALDAARALREEADALHVLACDLDLKVKRALVRGASPDLAELACLREHIAKVSHRIQRAIRRAEAGT